MLRSQRSTWNLRRPRLGALAVCLGAVGLPATVLVGCGATERHGAQTDKNPDQGQGATGGTDSQPGVSGGGGSSVPTSVNLHGEPKHYRFVRLTNSQWAASAQQVLALEQPPLELAEAFEKPIVGVTDFSNNEHLLDVDARRWSQLQAAAEALAEQVTSSEAALAAVYPGTDASGFIETVGRRAYSRPLTAEEVSALKGLFDFGATLAGEQSNFAKGAAQVIRGLLQSPLFLYRSELGETGAPLSGYEAAAKLSLWLRGATPSDALLDRAPTLTTAEAIEAEASHMLEDGAARAVMREFHGEYLRLSRYDQVIKAGVPTYEESLNAELKESSALFFDQLFQQGGGLREMLTSTRGFMGPRLAALYDLDAPKSGFIEADLGERRAGYFSQIPYLTLHSINETPDSIHRGLSLGVDGLCLRLPPPLSDLIPLPPLERGLTNRDRVTAATSACGGECHNEISNPLGFAFEHFDGMGQYRETEGPDELPIDSSGSFRFDDGRREFADNVELMEAIADSRQAHLCYAKKISSYALQRDIVAADLPWLDELAGVSQRDGSLKRLMLELARSEVFRTHVGAQP